MKPKGHKRECRCVICARPKRSAKSRTKPRTKSRVARRNIGYENQAASLHDRVAAGQATRKTRQNSAVRMNPDPANHVTIVSGPVSALREYLPTPTRSPKPASNPEHYPRTARGPKGSQRWFILDLFGARGAKISTRIKKGARGKIAVEASGLVRRRVNNRIVHRVELSGPYTRKPTTRSVRT